MRAIVADADRVWAARPEGLHRLLLAFVERERATLSVPAGSDGRDVAPAPGAVADWLLDAAARAAATALGAGRDRRPAAAAGGARAATAARRRADRRRRDRMARPRRRGGARRRRRLNDGAFASWRVGARSFDPRARASRGGPASPDPLRRSLSRLAKRPTNEPP